MPTPVVSVNIVVQSLKEIEIKSFLGKNMEK